MQKHPAKHTNLKPTNQANPRLNDTHIRLTDAELTKIKANQLREGHSSIAGYMRHRALDPSNASAQDKNTERMVIQAYTRIAGAIEKASPDQVKEAALAEAKRIIGEVVKL
jgi:hypothetical protein